MWCALPAATVEAASGRTDSIAWSPAAVLVPKWLIEIYAIAHVDPAVVATAGHTAGNCRKHDYQQSAHPPALH